MVASVYAGEATIVKAMRILRMAVYLCGFLSGGHAFAQAPMQLCELFKNPARFEHHVVRVEGIWVTTVHSAMFVHPDCTDKEWSAQLTFENAPASERKKLDAIWSQLREDRSIRLDIQGTFISDGRQHGPDGDPYLIQVDSIVGVTPLSKAYRRAHGFPR